MKLDSLLPKFAALAAAFALAGCCCTKDCCEEECPDGPCVGESCKVAMPQNSDFYTNGKFDQAKAKQAYFDMLERFDCPIYPQLKTDEFWVVDFKLNDFAHIGMGGIFWMNPNHKGGGYLGHEIYLLPGQMIAQHAHVATAKGPAKRESWQVRYGSVYNFSTTDKPMDLKPMNLPPAQMEVGPGIKPVNHYELVKQGGIVHLNEEGAYHFLMAGPEGAVVTEYANWHDGDGLRLANPKASL